MAIIMTKVEFMDRLADITTNILWQADAGNMEKLDHFINKASILSDVYKQHGIPEHDIELTDDPNVIKVNTCPLL